MRNSSINVSSFAFNAVICRLTSCRSRVKPNSSVRCCVLGFGGDWDIALGPVGGGGPDQVTPFEKLGVRENVRGLDGTADCDADDVAWLSELTPQGIRIGLSSRRGTLEAPLALAAAMVTLSKDISISSCFTATCNETGLESGSSWTKEHTHLTFLRVSFEQCLHCGGILQNFERCHHTSCRVGSRAHSGSR